MRLSNGDLEWEIRGRLPPLRVDRYLKSRLPHYSRSALQALIVTGGVLKVDRDGRERRLKPATRLRTGDLIRLKRPTPARRHSDIPIAPIDILYEDADMMVVNKPAGMLVHPAGVRVEGTLIGELRERFPERELDLAHRLDRETSGVLILTRKGETTRRMKTAFERRRVSKTYLAVARGRPEWTERVVDRPIGDANQGIRVQQAVRDDGAPSRTHFHVIERLPGEAVLIECRPETGRLHQIRVHLLAEGVYLYGDKLYGGDPDAFHLFREQGTTPELVARLGHWRQALHASALSCPHPVSGKNMRFTAPLPSDLVDLLDRLRAGGRPSPEVMSS